MVYNGDAERALGGLVASGHKKVGVLALGGEVRVDDDVVISDLAMQRVLTREEHSHLVLDGGRCVALQRGHLQLLERGRLLELLDEELALQHGPEVGALVLDERLD